MYTIRLLPLGAPVAAGITITTNGAVALLTLLGMLGLLLAVRATMQHARAGHTTSEQVR